MNIETYLEETTKARLDMANSAIEVFKNRPHQTTLAEVSMVKDLSQDEVHKMVEHFFEMHPTLKQWKEL